MIDGESKAFIDSLLSFGEIYSSVMYGENHFTFILESKRQTRQLIDDLKKSIDDFEKTVKQYDLV